MAYYNDPDTGVQHNYAGSQQPSWQDKALGAGAIGSGLWGMFGPHKNPAEEANNYISQVPGQISPYLQPYNQAGQNQLSGLGEQYGQLQQNPGGRLNQIGESFHESPGFKFALDQALQAVRNQSAAGGMANSPLAEQQAMTTATGLANQDYNNWLGRATDLYGEGLHGGQTMAGQGLQAGSSMADQIAQALSQQAELAYKGAAGENERGSNSISQMVSGLLPFLGGAMGGPFGAAAGAGAGSFLF